MNGVQNIVDEVQGEKAYLDQFPVAEQEGPKIYDNQITEQ
jgi:hypothetical protein